VLYVLGMLLGDELDGSLDLRLHISGRVLRYAGIRMVVLGTYIRHGVVWTRRLVRGAKDFGRCSVCRV
jgi:hypothetical protein